MEPSWEIRATCLVSQTLHAVLATIKLFVRKDLTAVHRILFDLVCDWLCMGWMYIMFAQSGFARQYRSLLAIYILILKFVAIDWQLLLDSVVAVWPTLVTLSIAGGSILAFRQHFPRLRGRVLL